MTDPDAMTQVARLYSLLRPEDRSGAAFWMSSRTLRAAEDYPLPRRDIWGEPPRIALVYALGLCDLDEGIEARELAEAFLAEYQAPAMDPAIREELEDFTRRRVAEGGVKTDF